MIDGILKRLKDPVFWGFVLSLVAVYFSPVLKGQMPFLPQLAEFVPLFFSALFGLGTAQSKSLLNPAPKD